jgi:colicin import membrane protein
VEEAAAASPSADAKEGEAAVDDAKAAAEAKLKAEAEKKAKAEAEADKLAAEVGEKAAVKEDEEK